MYLELHLVHEIPRQYVSVVGHEHPHQLGPPGDGLCAHEGVIATRRVPDYV